MADQLAFQMCYTAMKNNLLSLGQLLEKGYRITMEDNLLRLSDQKGQLILKAPLSKNRTFKIEILVNQEMTCMSAADDNSNWLWHRRMGHLNFSRLSRLHSERMVSGLPKITAPDKACEACCVSK